MVKSGSGVPAGHSTWMVIGPCCPAPVPVMVLLMTSSPETSVYVSVIAAVACAPGAMVIGVSVSPVTSAATVLVCPSAVSVATQVEPAGIPVYGGEDTVPAAVPAGIVKSGVRGVPLHSTEIVTGPCSPAASPAIVLVTTNEP